MYICHDCTGVFEKPKSYLERAAGDPLPFDEWFGCPYCGGCYSVLHICSICNEYILDDYITLKDGSDVCSHCFTPKTLQ